MLLMWWAEVIMTSLDDTLKVSSEDGDDEDESGDESV